MPLHPQITNPIASMRLLQLHNIQSMHHNRFLNRRRLPRLNQHHIMQPRPISQCRNKRSPIILRPHATRRHTFRMTNTILAPALPRQHHVRQRMLSYKHILLTVRHHRSLNASANSTSVTPQANQRHTRSIQHNRTLPHRRNRHSTTKNRISHHRQAKMTGPVARLLNRSRHSDNQTLRRLQTLPNIMQMRTRNTNRNLLPRVNRRQTSLRE